MGVGAGRFLGDGSVAKVAAQATRMRFDAPKSIDDLDEVYTLLCSMQVQDGDT
jgi:hypothetical protein